MKTGFRNLQATADHHNKSRHHIHRSRMIDSKMAGEDAMLLSLPLHLLLDVGMGHRLEQTDKP